MSPQIGGYAFLRLTIVFQHPTHPVEWPPQQLELSSGRVRQMAWMCRLDGLHKLERFGANPCNNDIGGFHGTDRLGPIQEISDDTCPIRPSSIQLSDQGSRLNGKSGQIGRGCSPRKYWAHSSVLRLRPTVLHVRSIIS
jgi:hypothetical protein